MREKIVVVGGNAAGMSAASQARRLDPRAEITVFEKGRRISYSACGLPFLISGEVRSASDLVLRDGQWFQSQRNISVHTEHEVTGIFPARHTLTVRERHGGISRQVPFTRLILATGALPVVPFAVPPQIQGVFTLRSLSDGEKIQEFVNRMRPRKGVIIGGGTLGAELAETFVRTGIQTTLLEQNDRILGEFEPEIASKMIDLLNHQGVQVMCGVEVQKLVDPGQIWCTGDHKFAFDICVMAVGIRPNSGLADAAGLDLTRNKAIAVNLRLESSNPHIYAAGDCAATWNMVLRQPDYVPLGTTANRQGQVAGENAAGGLAKYCGSAGTQVLRVFNTDFARTGITGAQAKRVGLKSASAVISTRDIPGYFDGSRPLTLNLNAEKITGRLLGVSMTGPSGTAKRIDLAAAALYSRLTISEMLDLDYGYSPPVSTAHDPFFIAARTLLPQLI